ncbi:MAG: protein phosphatase 2C domain-containing protein [Polyangiaceae bacterium]
MFDPPISSTHEEAPVSPPPRGVTFGQATDRGRLRRDNEDHLGSAPDIGFFMVADGVGGGPAGAVASRIATAAMLQSLRTRPDAPQSDNPATSPREPAGPVETHAPRLVAAALSAHELICAHARRHGQQGAATTMAALWLTRGHYLVANAGDSRIYRLAGEDSLQQLTKDHTVIQELLERHGSVSEQWMQRLGHVVTQVLGGRRERPPAVQIAAGPVTKREVFLLCTDGLTNMVPERRIASVLATVDSPQEASDILVDLANEAGGLDNITCIVVHIDP